MSEASCSVPNSLWLRSLVVLLRHLLMGGLLLGLLPEPLLYRGRMRAHQHRGRLWGCVLEEGHCLVRIMASSIARLLLRREQWTPERGVLHWPQAQLMLLLGLLWGCLQWLVSCLLTKSWPWLRHWLAPRSFGRWGALGLTQHGIDRVGGWVGPLGLVGPCRGLQPAHGEGHQGRGRDGAGSGRLLTVWVVRQRS